MGFLQCPFVRLSCVLPTAVVLVDSAKKYKFVLSVCFRNLLGAFGPCRLLAQLHTRQTRLSQRVRLLRTTKVGSAQRTAGHGPKS